MLVVRFLRDRRGGVAPLLALSMIPIVGAVGSAVDYSRAAAIRGELQNAMDSALLAAATGDGTAWQQTAGTTYNAVASPRDATLNQPTFSVDATGNYVGTATANVPARFMGLLGHSSIAVSVTSTVKPGGDDDNSCILTLDAKNAALSNVSMLFGGAPNIALQGCSTRSNTAMNCNGHDSGATRAIAAGSASGCSNTRSYARQLPDIYSPMASSITKLCGGLSGGGTWTPTSAPAGLKTLSKGSYTEYHVCGTLTLSGSGELAGGTAGQDRLIVVENGGIKLSTGANISVTRTTIILTGSNNGSNIDFPQGNGQSASLSLSPSIGTDNPWKGIALYQDPALTFKVANDWGPGATFKADGVVYLPNSDLETQGVAQSNNYKCSKVVTKSFTTKGSVSLSFAQEKDGCKAISMKQWSDIPIHIVR